MSREKKSVSRSSPVSGYTISAVYQRGDRGCRHLVLMRNPKAPFIPASLHLALSMRTPKITS